MGKEQNTAMANFFDAILTDEALAAQVAELAGKAGFPFSAEDLLELGKAQPLSDGEAAEAAGGLDTGRPYYTLKGSQRTDRARELKSCFPSSV